MVVCDQFWIFTNYVSWANFCWANCVMTHQIHWFTQKCSLVSDFQRIKITETERPASDILTWKRLGPLWKRRPMDRLSETNILWHFDRLYPIHITVKLELTGTQSAPTALITQVPLWPWVGSNPVRGSHALRGRQGRGCGQGLVLELRHAVPALRVHPLSGYLQRLLVIR